MPKLKEGKQKQATMTVYLPQSLKDKLVERAEAIYSNPSALIRSLLLEHLDK
jgi:Arc/MetJ-type ribon-helix-helix transcriptional regulator